MYKIQSVRNSNYQPSALWVNDCLHLCLLCKNKVFVPQRYSFHFKQVLLQSMLSYQSAKNCGWMDRWLFSFLYIAYRYIAMIALSESTDIFQQWISQAPTFLKFWLNIFSIMAQIVNISSILSESILMGFSDGTEAPNCWGKPQGAPPFNYRKL